MDMDDAVYLCKDVHPSLHDECTDKLKKVNEMLLQNKCQFQCKLESRHLLTETLHLIRVEVKSVWT